MQTYNQEPTLTYVLGLLKEDIFSTLNCHAIGKIESFDASKQRAKVSISYQRIVENNSSTSKRLDYPLLTDVPVLIVGGGKGSLRFPIEVGDYCSLLFNDRDIDNFLETGAKTPLNSDRKHDFTDGIAIVGLRPTNKIISDYSTTKTELVHDQTKISLEDKIKINNATQSLFAVLDSMMDILVTLSAGVGVPPSNPIYPALTAQVTLAKTNLALLME